jgi:hypothetical protein
VLEKGSNQALALIPKYSLTTPPMHRAAHLPGHAVSVSVAARKQVESAAQLAKLPIQFG